uniref:Retrotransposon gag domain-containing protein n=1 Tax=Amblyomma maculatum TaxID=34609 RepID=G3MQY8_AMBMU
MASQLGLMEPFDDSTSDWTSYDERLASYLKANKVPDDLQVDVFVSLIGPKTYQLLKYLTAPDKATSKSLTELRELLSKHLSPKPSIIAERAKFYRAVQRETQTIAQFVEDIRRLAQTCEFGSFLDDALRDKFVYGLRRIDIQRQLFVEDKHLTFQKAIDRALAAEAE